MAAGAPCFYLKIFGWDSLAAVSAVFAADVGAEILEGAPFVKLRSCERECVPPLAALGSGSWLAKVLAAGDERKLVGSRIEWLLSR